MDKGTPWKKQTWTTFFYGVCTEDRLTDVIKQAEEDGCELVQVIPGMIPAPVSAVALPGARPQNPILVMRILVRILDEDYEALVKQKQTPDSKLVN